MKIAITSISILCATAVTFAQSPPPPDPFGELAPMDMGYWENLGQLTDPEGNQTFEATFYSEGCYPVSFPANGSRISYVVSQSGNDSLVPDTVMRWDVHFSGDGAQQVDPIGVAAHPDYRNFYFPHCGEQGITNVRRFERVVYSDIYPGIDLHVYAGGAGQKLALVCRPGSDPAGIQMLFEGVSELSILPNGDLQFPALAQLMALPHPFAYQFDGTTVLDLPQDSFQFALQGNELRFALGSYDQSLPLVLFIGQETREGEIALSGNNGLCWSTYYGGNLGERIEGSSLDLKDNHYAAGWMNSSWASFPQTLGSHAPYNQAVMNAFVSRFTYNDELHWTTLFGGLSPTRTMAYDVAVKDIGDGNPMSYVVGYTNSANFPVQTAGVAYFDGAGMAGVDQGFLFKVDGAGIRKWATYFGEQNTQVLGAVVGGSREVVFTGYSNNLPHEQITPPAGSSHFTYSGGGKDVFAAMLNTADQLAWRTYYGGFGEDGGADIAYSPVDKGVFYITGWTTSSNFPQVIKPGAYNHGHFGGLDRILMRFDPMCKLKWATCFGGPSDDYCSYESLEVDWTGDVYMVGTTQSSSFPLLASSYPGAYFNGAYNSYDQGFVSRFNRTTQALEWSTFMGTGFTSSSAVSSSKSSAGIFVGGGVQDGSIPLVPGYGSWYYQPFIYPNQNGPATYYQDPFIFRFDKNNVIQWSTYFGGEAFMTESIKSLACPKNSQTVLAYGETSKYLNVNSFFPLQPSAWPLAYYDYTFNSGTMSGDCFITRFCSGAQTLQQEVHNSTMHEETALMSMGDQMYRIKGVDGPGKMNVFNPVGQLVRSSYLSGNDGNSSPFSLAGMPAGVYILCFPGIPAQRIIIGQ